MNRRLILIVYAVIINIVHCGYLSLKISPKFTGSGGKTNICSRSSASFIGPCQNVLQCARKCGNDPDCKGLVFSETGRWCEVVHDNGSANTSSNSGTLYQVESRTRKECGKWKRVLSVNSSGETTFGHIGSLKHSLLSGQTLRIIVKSATIQSKSFSINSVLISEDFICAQSEVFISYNNYPALRFVLICTNGTTQKMIWHVGSSNMISRTFFETSNWFIRETNCLQPIYNDERKSTVVIFNQLKAKQAFTMIVVQTADNFTKIHYSTHSNILDSFKEVTVTSVGEISKVLSESSVKFTENPSWVATKYNFTNTIEEKMCSINVSKPCEVQVKTVNQKTYIDVNWEVVLHHTAAGIAVLGSVCTLKDRIMQGNRMIAHFNGHVREPDIVVVDDDDITAFFTSYPLKQDTSENTEIVWELLSTTGRYESLVFDRATGEILNETKGSEESIWFVENAEWASVYGPENNTTEKLYTAIESGSSLRIKANCLYVNNIVSTNYTCLFNPAMIGLIQAESRVCPKFQIYPGISAFNSELHFAKKELPMWMSFTVGTNGCSGKLRKVFWVHENSYYESVSVDNSMNAVWYAH